MNEVLAGWDRSSFSAAGFTHDIYRKGSGPGVIVIHEMPGITPKVAEFADQVVDRGFTVVMPDLVGTPGKPVAAPYLLSQPRQGVHLEGVHVVGTQSHVADHVVAAGLGTGATPRARWPRGRRRRDVLQRRIRARHDGRRPDGGAGPVPALVPDRSRQGRSQRQPRAVTRRRGRRDPARRRWLPGAGLAVHRRQGGRHPVRHLAPEARRRLHRDRVAEPVQDAITRC